MAGLSSTFRRLIMWQLSLLSVSIKPGHLVSRMTCNNPTDSHGSLPRSLRGTWSKTIDLYYYRILGQNALFQGKGQCLFTSNWPEISCWGQAKSSLTGKPSGLVSKLRWLELKSWTGCRNSIDYGADWGRRAKRALGLILISFWLQGSAVPVY